MVFISSLSIFKKVDLKSLSSKSKVNFLIFFFEWAVFYFYLHAFVIFVEKWTFEYYNVIPRTRFSPSSGFAVFDC